MELFEVDGCRGYIFQGVFFTEKFPGTAASIKEVSATSNVQNTNLDWLREKLAGRVKSLGGNALIGFRYVQKANFMSFSSVSWNADGTAARIEGLDLLASAGSQNKEVSEYRDCPVCAESIKTAATMCRFCRSRV